MDRLILEQYVTTVLIEKLGKEELPIKLAFFKELWHNNILDEQRVFKGCVNHYYDKQYKINECVTKDTILDTAIEFECSTKTVCNIIYKYRHVRIDF